jgi:hypothetical protein
VAIGNEHDALWNTRCRTRSHTREISGSQQNAREMALPNVAAFSVMIFVIYSRCLHDLRPTITPPHALALRRARLMRGNALHARRGGDHSRRTVNAARF